MSIVVEKVKQYLNGELSSESLVKACQGIIDPIYKFKVEVKSSITTSGKASRRT